MNTLPDEEQAVIRTGHFTIDRDHYLVTVDGRPIRFTYMEFNALLVTVEQSGRVVTYDRLAEALWGSSGPAARRRPQSSFRESAPSSERRGRHRHRHPRRLPARPGVVDRTLNLRPE